MPRIVGGSHAKRSVWSWRSAAYSIPNGEVGHRSFGLSGSTGGSHRVALRSRTSTGACTAASIRDAGGAERASSTRSRLGWPRLWGAVDAADADYRSRPGRRLVIAHTLGLRSGGIVHLARARQRSCWLWL